MPRKRWTAGESVLAAEFNPNVADQVAATYADAATRAAGWPTPPAGALSVLTDPTAAASGLETYLGGQWRRPWNLPWGILDVKQNTAGPTVNAQTDIPGLTSTLTYPANRRVKLTFASQGAAAGAAIFWSVYIMEGATQIMYGATATAGAGYPAYITLPVLLVPTAGAHTYKCQAATGRADGALQSSATAPAWFTVEDVGPAGPPA